MPKLTNKQGYLLWFSFVIFVFIYFSANFVDEYRNEINKQVNVLDNIASKAAIKITKSATFEANRIKQLSNLLSHYVPSFSNREEAKIITSPWLINLNQGQFKQYGVEIVLVTDQNGIVLNGKGKFISSPSTGIEKHFYDWLAELGDSNYKRELIINSNNNDIDFYTINRVNSDSLQNIVVIIKFKIRIEAHQLDKLADKLFIVGEHNIAFTLHDDKPTPIIIEFDAFPDLITDTNYIENKVGMKPINTVKVSQVKINDVDLTVLSTIPNKYFFYSVHAIEGTGLKLLLFYDAKNIKEGIDEEVQEFALTILVLMGLMIILTKLLQYHYKIQALVHHDPLTNLLNRAHFKQTISALVHLHDRQKITHLGVLSLDIDKFKLINDNYGHGVGDEILITLAKLMMETSRVTDLVYRFGGEEFIILTAGETLQSLHIFAERIRHAVEIQTETIDILPNGYTLSIGVAERKLNESIDDAIKRSDEMLYKAKNSGRNKVVSQ
ncbi:GGDEF domain-containing protein [Colwellia piezophila]|uniref:GGDEF domain-containing protein n=1 Tax=Colwellia piezophila TaxID=211668 RepID=UPI0003662F27|nr:GGDEF domain-containing protein [Colwellia piezophila]